MKATPASPLDSPALWLMSVHQAHRWHQCPRWLGNGDDSRARWKLKLGELCVTVNEVERERAVLRGCDHERVVVKKRQGPPDRVSNNPKLGRPHRSWGPAGRPKARVEAHLRQGRRPAVRLRGASPNPPDQQRQGRNKGR